MRDESVVNLTREERRCSLAGQFAATANVDASPYEEAKADHRCFWAEQAGAEYRVDLS